MAKHVKVKLYLLSRNNYDYTTTPRASVTGNVLVERAVDIFDRAQLALVLPKAASESRQQGSGPVQSQETVSHGDSYHSSRHSAVES